MITILPDFIQYSEISQDVVDHHNLPGQTFVWIETPLTHQTVIDGDDVRLEPPDYDVSQAEVDEGYRRIRRFLFERHTDAIFMKTQRGEATEAEWIAAVDAIKNEWAPPSVAV